MIDYTKMTPENFMRARAQIFKLYDQADALSVTASNLSWGNVIDNELHNIIGKAFVAIFKLRQKIDDIYDNGQGKGEKR